jgi:hypothetical protein
MSVVATGESDDQPLNTAGECGVAGAPPTAKAEDRSAIAVLLALPLLLLALQPGWIFPKHGIDSWVYHGYFHNYPAYVTRFYPNAYYGTRLSWVLPGYVLYHLLPATAAAIVMHLAVYYTGIFSLYSISKRCLSPRPALMGCLFMGMYYLYVNDTGWDYVDGLGMASYLLTMALLIRGLRSPRCTMWMFAGGATAGAMLHTNIFLVCLTPTFPLAYLMLARHFGRGLRIKTLFVDAAATAGGVILLTVIFGAINRAVGADFLFFMPSVKFAAELHQSNPWTQVWYDGWWRSAILPTVMVLATLLMLIRHAVRPLFSPVATPAVFLGVNYLACAAIMLYMQLHGSPILQCFYYASYLTGPMFMAFAMLLAPVSERFSFRQAAAISIAIIVLLATPYVKWLPWMPHINAEQLRNSGIVLAMLAVTMLVLWPMRKTAFLAALLCWSGAQHVLFDAPMPHAKELFVRIEQGIAAVSTVTHGRKPRFWYDANEPQSTEFRSLASNYLWGYVLISDNFPKINPSARYLLQPDSIVVICSQFPRALNKAEQALAAEGMHAKFLKSSTIQKGPVAYTLTFAEIQPARSPKLPGVTLSFDALGRIATLNAGPVAADAELPQHYWTPCFPPAQMAASFAPPIWRVQTGTSQFQYAMTGPIIRAAAPGKYRFNLHYRVISGKAVFGLLKEDLSAWIAQASEDPTENGQDWQNASVTVQLNAGQGLCPLICNANSNGNHPSEFEFDSMRISPVK